MEAREEERTKAHEQQLAGARAREGEEEKGCCRKALVREKKERDAEEHARLAKGECRTAPKLRRLTQSRL